jgi:hypothetical protein
LFTDRSGFFRAARKPEWLKDNPKNPVDLEDEDAEVFGTYVNCVYFGSEALQHYQHYVDPTASESESESDRDQREKELDAECEALIRVYLIADRLQDLITTNMAIDELVRFRTIMKHIPDKPHISLVYGQTAENSPLRRLMRDYWAYEIVPSEMGQLKGFPKDFVRDIAVEAYRVMGKHQENEEQTIEEAFSEKASDRIDEDKCYYHQHDDKHPRCVPKEISSK